MIMLRRNHAFTPSLLAAGCLLGGLSQTVGLTSSVTAAETAAEEVRIKLGTRGGNKTWRGRVGDRITIVFFKGGKDESFTGKLSGVQASGKKSILIVSNSKEKKMFRSDDIRSITSAEEGSGDAAVTATDENNNLSVANSSASSDEAPQNAEPIKSVHAWGFPTEPKNGNTDLPKVFFLPIQGGVGDGTRHNEMKQIGEIADKLAPEGAIIVLQINSPGGLVLEADRISATLTDIGTQPPPGRLDPVRHLRRGIYLAALSADLLHEDRKSGLCDDVRRRFRPTIDGPELAAWVKKFGDIAEENGHSQRSG